MRYTKWILTIVLLVVFTSFIGKNKTTHGLGVGDMAPDFNMLGRSVSATAEQGVQAEQAIRLSALKGQYVLLSFWASYDAEARMSNALLSHVLQQSDGCNIKLISVSFDRYYSVFSETVRRDHIEAESCFVDTQGEFSELYKKYRLHRGLTNYLLDTGGVIIAKNISATQLSEFVTDMSL